MAVEGGQGVGVFQVGPRLFQQHLAGGHPAAGIDGQIIAPGGTGVVVGHVDTNPIQDARKGRDGTEVIGKGQRLAHDPDQPVGIGLHE